MVKKMIKDAGASNLLILEPDMRPKIHWPSPSLTWRLEKSPEMKYVKCHHPSPIQKAENKVYPNRDTLENNLWQTKVVSEGEEIL